MHTITKSRGFTLIELLVVIAIIGILSSIVLASLNSARNKGADAAVKSNLNGIRAQMEIFYDDHNNAYESGTDSGCDDDTNVLAAIAAAQAANGGASAVANCYDDADSWAAVAGLVAQSGQFYCVDSSGTANTYTTNNVSNTDHICAN